MYACNQRLRDKLWLYFHPCGTYRLIANAPARPPTFFSFAGAPCSCAIKVTVTVCDGPPSPRANFTVTSLPTGDMILFGGECFDGQDTKCFNELFRCVCRKSSVCLCR